MQTKKMSQILGHKDKILSSLLGSLSLADDAIYMEEGLERPPPQLYCAWGSGANWRVGEGGERLHYLHHFLMANPQASLRPGCARQGQQAFFPLRFLQCLQFYRERGIKTIGLMLLYHVPDSTSRNSN